MGKIVQFIFFFVKAVESGVGGDGFVGEGTCCANVRPEFKSPAPHKKPSMTLCLPLPQHCRRVETSLTGACSLPASLQVQRPTLSEENRQEC